MSDDEGFKINEDYANRYNRWREKEELQKLKDKYGDTDKYSTDSSSSESEDEDGYAITSKQEKNWLKALSALKCKDPKIYDKNVVFFKEDSKSDSDGSGADDSVKSKQKPSKKPMFLKDYEREVITKKGGVIESDDSEAEEEKEQAATSKPGYFEEQAALRKGLVAAVNSDESDELLLSRRVKSKDIEEKEEEDYIEWLKGRKDKIDGGEQFGVELNSLKDYWDNPQLETGEKFLRDYILNKRYKEGDESTIPSYEDIVGEEDEGLSDDETTIEKQETFERKFNFRYEEPDEEFIKTYPRTMGESVRKKDNKRSEHRQTVKERKLKEKEKQKEELKQLKNLKRNEIMNKLDTLKEITGNPSLGFTEEDIENDFDPKKHDEMMQKVFDQEYYDLDVDVDGKPVFSEMEDLDGHDEDWDNWQGPSGDGYAEPDCEDEDFNMDADYNPNQPQVEDRSYGLDGKSKKKRRSKFAQAVDNKKPVYNPEDKTFEEYFDEYYKLDYEDMIGDLPCRFKYRPVPANNFGLSTEEVISAKDKELNAWVSLKKMSIYRTEEEEIFDKKIFQKKGRNSKKKFNIMPSLLPESAQESDSEVDNTDQPQPSTSGAVPSTSGITPKSASKNKKKKKKKKPHVPVVGKDTPSKAKHSDNERKRVHENASGNAKGFKRMKLDNSNQDSAKRTGDSTETGKKKKRKGRGKKPVMSDERLKAYGIDPKKYKYSSAAKKPQS